MHGGYYLVQTKKGSFGVDHTAPLFGPYPDDTFLVANRYRLEDLFRKEYPGERGYVCISYIGMEVPPVGYMNSRIGYDPQAPFPVGYKVQ